METIKKKYNKKITEGKITVKHYLHKNKQEDNNGNTYSIYVQLTVKRQVTNFKSKIEPFNLIEENEWKIRNYGLFKSCVERDKGLIQYIVTKLKPFDNDEFDIKSVVKIYNFEEINLEHSFDNFLMWEISEFYCERKLPTDVKPISYLGFYSEDKTLTKKASKYKSKIWYLEVIISQVRNVHPNISNQFILLEPTIYDFISGYFINNIIENKTLNVEDSKKLLEEMTTLYNIYQKDYWNH